MKTRGNSDSTASGQPASDQLSADQLSRLIDHQLHTLYQPTIDILRAQVIGYESFVRGPEQHALELPDALFRQAQAQGLTSILETRCQALAIDDFVARHFDGQLFINCEPAAFLDPSFERHSVIKTIEAHGLTPAQVVIELTAEYFQSDFAALRSAIDHYRELGFHTAIGDLGTGHDGLRLWSEIQPEYVKLDQHFTRGISHSSVKQSFVGAIVNLCASLQTTLIATGVETIDERDALRALGVHCMQGYFFARPSAYPLGSANALLTPAPRRRVDDKQLALDLATMMPPVTPDTVLGALWLRFEDHPNTQALPVVAEDGQPYGFIHRSHLYKLFARPGGRALYSQDAVRRHITTDSLIVHYNTLLSELSHRITESDNELVRQQFIVIDEQGLYQGVGKARDVLRSLNEQHLRVARHANPLTHLPGNVPTNEHMEELIRQRRLASVAYIDIDSFKPFNDTYGYQLGDQIIITLAQLLQEHLTSRDYFVGHIGGDDFVVVATTDHALPRLRLLQFEFTQAVQRLMLLAGENQNAYSAVDRYGVLKQFELPTVSIGIVQIKSAQPGNLDALIPALTHIKHRSKLLGGSGIAESDWRPDC